ncbi:MAG: PfkB family carbohydrate kinase [Deinococcales bacterium]
MKEILVIGSINMDIVVKVPRHPQAGETILGGQAINIAGGKGANQAVAAARARSDEAIRVRMVGRVGSDGYGQELKRSLAEAGLR